MPHLVLPSERYKESFLQAVKENQQEENKQSLRYADVDVEQAASNFAAFVMSEKEKAAGKHLPEGFVPETVYWLVDGDKFIGRVSIRHILNEYLRREGGHIGYDIRPSKRRMGYGKKALGLGLQKAKEMGLENVLITCDVSNVASKKIIEQNNGKLENIVAVENGKPAKMRYWITV